MVHNTSFRWFFRWLYWPNWVSETQPNELRDKMKPLRTLYREFLRPQIFTWTKNNPSVNLCKGRTRKITNRRDYIWMMTIAAHQRSRFPQKEHSKTRNDLELHTFTLRHSFIFICNVHVKRSLNTGSPRELIQTRTEQLWKNNRFSPSRSL